MHNFSLIFCRHYVMAHTSWQYDSRTRRADHVLLELLGVILEGVVQLQQAHALDGVPHRIVLLTRLPDQGAVDVILPIHLLHNSHI